MRVPTDPWVALASPNVEEMVFDDARSSERKDLLYHRDAEANESVDDTLGAPLEEEGNDVYLEVESRRVEAGCVSYMN